MTGRSAPMINQGAGRRPSTGLCIGLPLDAGRQSDEPGPGRASHLSHGSTGGVPRTGHCHASRYLELIEAHPDLAEDWDRAFAHEAMARALAMAGDSVPGERQKPSVCAPSSPRRRSGSSSRPN